MTCLSFSSMLWSFKWKPTSPLHLQKAESRMFEQIKTPIVTMMVQTKKHQINTLHTPRDSQKPNLVLVHGFGGGIGFWAKNIDALEEKFNVFAVDLVGFGRSSYGRPNWKKEVEVRNTKEEAQVVEDWWTDSLEEWRKAVGLNEPFVLLGHSLGGYLTAAYTMKYPDQVKHLVMVDPAGIPALPKESTINWKWRFLASLFWKMNPLNLVRISGPWGPSLVNKMRPDFLRRFGYEDNRILDYIYHNIAQNGSGESAFTSLFHPLGYAKLPLMERMQRLKNKVTFIYGEQSWMNPGHAVELRQRMEYQENVEIILIPNAGHHVYVDNYSAFNRTCVENID